MKDTAGSGGVMARVVLVETALRDVLSKAAIHDQESNATSAEALMVARDAAAIVLEDGHPYDEAVALAEAARNA